MEKQYEFDEPDLLSIVAMGNPGKRTFFLVIGAREKWLRLWLEKEHLEALAIATDQFLVKLSEKFPGYRDESDTDSLYPAEPSGFPSGEFEIEQIGIGLDQEKVIFEFVIHKLGPQRVNEILVSCRTVTARVKMLRDQARDICAAGRPRCEFCGDPIDPEGHDCPNQN